MLNSGLQAAGRRNSAACFIFFFILLIAVYPSKVFSQISSADNPVPGDIIFTQVGSTNPDRIEFITLKRLNLTSMKITDNAVLSNGTLSNTEGSFALSDLKYSALTDVPEGTFVRFEQGSSSDETDPSDRFVTYYLPNSSFLLSTEGDQVIAYTGSSSSPTYIAGINFGNSGWITSGTPNSNTSYAPNTISDIQLGNYDNYRFKDDVNQNADFTRNFIKDVTHWEGSNTIYEFTMKNIGNTFLPVELTSFSAQYFQKKVLLKWATATEVNNFGWDIERKYDRHNWQKIGFIQGKGNSNSPLEYSFSDNSILSGKLFFYRLKQIDNDGQTSQYSEALEVAIPAANCFSVEQNYPNPFNNSTVISYSIAEESMVSLRLYNILGEEIASFINAKQLPGKYDFRLNLSAIENYGALHSGIYLYKLQAGNFSIIRKFILLK